MVKDEDNNYSKQAYFKKRATNFCIKIRNTKSRMLENRYLLFNVDWFINQPHFSLSLTTILFVLEVFIANTGLK